MYWKENVIGECRFLRSSEWVDLSEKRLIQTAKLRTHETAPDLKITGCLFQTYTMVAS